LSEEDEVYISREVMDALLDAKSMIEISGMKIKGFKLRGCKLYMQIEDILIEDASVEETKKKK